MTPDATSGELQTNELVFANFCFDSFGSSRKFLPLGLLMAQIHRHERRKLLASPLNCNTIDGLVIESSDDLNY